MAYTPTTWVDGSTKLGPTNLNHLESGVQATAVVADAAIPKPASPASNDGLVWNGSSWVNAKLVNANIDSAAAIAYSKLNLASSIVDADVATAAAIAASKLASYPSDGTKALFGDGTWKVPGSTVTYRKTTTKTVNTTLAATDLLNGEITVAANAMGASGLVRLTAWGDWLNNTGGGVTLPRFQLLFGATIFLDTGTPTNGYVSSASRAGWRVTAVIANAGATNSQTTEMHVDLTDLGTAGTGGTTSVAFVTGNGVYGMVFGSSGGVVTSFQATAEGSNSGLAIDTTAAKALVLNVINGSVSASCETKLLGALVEVI